MLNFDPNSYQLNEQYRQDRMNEAEHQRLIDLVKQKQPSRRIWSTWIVLIGNILVKLGELMQGQTMQPEPKNTISRPVT